jgi:actin-like ATPase involved in cell morphogenesis
MAAKRKQISMRVTVSVPLDMTAIEARREVRTLINEQCNWLSRIDEGDVKAIAVKPAPKSPSRRRAPLCY